MKNYIMLISKKVELLTNVMSKEIGGQIILVINGTKNR